MHYRKDTDISNFTDFTLNTEFSGSEYDSSSNYNR